MRKWILTLIGLALVMIMSAPAMAIEGEGDTQGNPQENTASLYTVLFDKNANGAEGTMDAQTLEIGTKQKLKANTFTRTGWSFDGWSTEPGITKAAYEDQAEVLNLADANQTLTLYAQWRINQYTITFDSDGDSPIEPITDDYGTAITAPEAPTKTGYTFTGWEPAVPKTIPAGNMTCKAQWQINQHTITYQSDTGELIKTTTQDYGTEISQLEVPDKEGFAFKEWKPALPQTMPDKDLTVQAAYATNVWIGGTRVDQSNMNDVFGDGKVRYDVATKTLTIDDSSSIPDELHERSMIYSEDPLTIKAPNGLTLTSEKAGNAVYVKRDLTIDGNVTINCPGNGLVSAYGNVSVQGNIDITSGSTAAIHADGGAITLIGEVEIDSTSDSILSRGDITIKGNVNAKGRIQTLNSSINIEGNVIAESSEDGIRAGQDVIITGSVDVTCNKSGYIGVFANNLIKIVGDPVTVKGTAEGLYSRGNVELTGGVYKVSCEKELGIFAQKDIILHSGTFTVTGGWNALNTETGSIEIKNDVASLTATGGGTSSALSGYTGITLDQHFFKITQPVNGRIEGKYVVDSEGNSVSEVSIERKPEPKLDTNPQAKTGLVSNGQAQELVTAGTATGGILHYALGTEKEPNGEYAEAIPQGTAAGTYYVWYKVVGDTEHSDTKPEVLTVTIARPSTGGGTQPVDPDPGQDDPQPGDDPGEQTDPADQQYQDDIAKAGEAKTILIKAINKKGKKVLVKWKKISGVSGYQIQYSVKKSFKKGVKTRKVGAKKKAIKLKKLKKGKTYYVRVLPYTKVTHSRTGESRIVFGKTSNTKKVRIRK